jgi:amino acid transporter
MTIEARAGDRRVEAAPSLHRELGLADLVSAQILFIVGLPWVGVAAKQGPAHIVFWLIAMALFYLPSAAVVIFLNRRMPLEGGLYQWARSGFGELVGFLVAWNLWLFAILNTSETGIQATQYLSYILGPIGERLAASKVFTAFVSALVFSGLVLIAIRGLSVGKWLHKSGGALLLMTFSALILLPWLNLATGAIPEFHPLTVAAPVVSVMSLNLLGKMGFGALGGFEYVAIHAGECRDPVRTITRSVLVAAPIICIMFILGTSSVLGLIPMDRIDLIAPIPQVLSVGFRPLGSVAWVAPVTIVILLIVRIAQASVTFTGITRLPMVAGWDGLLPRWFTELHDGYRTPVNSIAFVGAMTFVFSLAGVIGVGQQEGFQLLWNASAIFYALTYLVMFALPIIGLQESADDAPLWLKLAAVSGFGMTLLYVTLSILPIVNVNSPLVFSMKICGVIAATNAIGVALYRRQSRLGRTTRS